MNDEQRLSDLTNGNFLLVSDAQILLHLEELAAGVATTLAAADFVTLVAQRAAARAQMVGAV